MANKNSRQRRRALAIAGKRAFADIRKHGRPPYVVSSRPNRNRAMVVYHNVGSNGKIHSLTAHEALKRSTDLRVPNHHYMENTYKSRIDSHGNQKPTHEQPAEGFAFDNKPIHV